MKKSQMWLVSVYFFALFALVVSCTEKQGPQGPTGATGAQGPVGPQGPQGPAGSSCTAVQESNGVQVTCTDGSSGLVQNGATGTAGAAGAPGTTGAAGANGHSALLTSFPNDTNCGTAGGTLLLGGVDLNDDGILENTEVTVSADLCNGATGATGATGPAGASPEYSPVIVINPCGPNSSQYKEALLGLSGGGVFGAFSENSSALTVRNTLIPDGSYYDTDDSGCNFSLSTSGTGRLVSWDGSSATGANPFGVSSGNPFGAGNATYTSSTSAWADTYTAPGN